MVESGKTEMCSRHSKRLQKLCYGYLSALPSVWVTMEHRRLGDSWPYFRILPLAPCNKKLIQWIQIRSYTGCANINFDYTPTLTTSNTTGARCFPARSTWTHPGETSYHQHYNQIKAIVLEDILISVNIERQRKGII